MVIMVAKSYLPSPPQSSCRVAKARGVTMIEVLITIVIVSVGLVGLAKLQSTLQINEMESYQRSQALLLVKDMANRIAINRKVAQVTTSYVVNPGTLWGSGMTCPTTSSSSTLAQVDLAEWCLALQGAAEVEVDTATSTSTQMGSVIGGRGCIEQLTDPNEYMVTIAWQGMAPLAAPASTVACGATLYYTTNGSVCDASELCRRTVTTVVKVL